MDEMIFEGVTSYYNALEKLGYMSYGNMQRLLILIFYRDFVYNDYRANLSKEDYYTIEKALDCLYGTTCLIPYPDYLKMGKLHLGEVTEIAERLRNIENTDVMKLMEGTEGCGDISLVVCGEEPEEKPEHHHHHHHEPLWPEPYPDFPEEPCKPVPPKPKKKRKKHVCK